MTAVLSFVWLWWSNGNVLIVHAGRIQTLGEGVGTREIEERGLGEGGKCRVSASASTSTCGVPEYSVEDRVFLYCHSVVDLDTSIFQEYWKVNCKYAIRYR